MTPSWDVVIVGGGMAGVSLAWRLAPRLRVLLLEAEPRAGVHSTGRSAAMFMESYGSPQARALTRASRAFYERPPAGFCEQALVAPRGALYAAWDGQQADLEALQASLESTGTAIERLGAARTLQRVPVLRSEGLVGALWEADALDLDVEALHQGFLRGARRQGAELRVDSAVLAGVHQGGLWRLTCADGSRLHSPVVVNAAGAWADEVARRCTVAPLGIEPRRRSAFTFDAPAGVDCRAWPVFSGVAHDWYVKPDAGQLLGSPANADPVPPHDVQPEELDIAGGIFAIERDTALRIRRPRRAWAGLRSFAPDDELVIGFDAAAPGFFWLAGQGGCGIQSAAGASALAASLIEGRPLPDELLLQQVSPHALSPGRLRGPG